MGAKTVAKRLLGRALSIEWLEKLTEYAIDRQPGPAHLNGAADLTPPGTGWDEVVEEGRRRIWRETFARLGPDVLLLEFGVWKGDSMRYFAGLNQSPRSLFYGFDSFEGLPDEWRGMKAGHFSTAGQIPQIDDPRVRFVKGWFQDSLPPMMDEIAAAAEGRSVVVNFDADLYSSTLFLLFTLGARLRAYTFLFDEYAGHEARALHNYLQATGATVEFLSRCDWQGFPMTVAGEITGH
jgi:hypothetical protein